MDTLAHAVLGALCCSRSGLPGGCRGAVDAEGKRRAFDWTVWAAAGFALIPDMSSFGAFFIQRLCSGTLTPGKPDLDILPPYVFTNYNITHSLVIAAAVGLIIRLCWKPLFLPFLAWPLHVLCDIPMHSLDYFATPFLYPLSDFRVNGISFGDHRWMIPLYWGIIAVISIFIVAMRRGWIKCSSEEAQEEFSRDN